jgi:hypothetical protein
MNADGSPDPGWVKADSTFCNSHVRCVSNSSAPC